jgi:hypothetical protein
MNPEVKRVFDKYPDFVRAKMFRLRELVLETARETNGITQLEETLKWGEPSYLTKGGSTIRMDWKDKTPDQYALYFKCTSRLIETFKTTYDQLFEFENNRAIVFRLDQEIPREPLKRCIKAALTYHQVKYLPTISI